MDQALTTLLEGSRTEAEYCTVHAVLSDLKCCSLRRNLQRGRRIHAKATASGHGSNMYVTSALIKMYAKCGSMIEARKVFDSIQKPDVVSWSALLLGYADNGEGHVTLEMFSRMKTRGCAPNAVTYLAALKACTSLATTEHKALGLQRAKSIHSEIGCHLDLYVQNTLISMYGKLGSMVEAQGVFNSIRKPSLVSWNALLLGYAENGDAQVALELFSNFKSCGCAPDSLTYVAVLKACTALAVNRDSGGKAYCLELGRRIRAEIGGSHLNLYVQNTLIDMYSKCGSMVDACQEFNSVKVPDVVSWNALLFGYVENGSEKNAILDLFSRMKRVCHPNAVTYVAVLKACTLNADAEEKAQSLETGRSIESEIGKHTDLYVQSTLIDMYAKCGSMLDARRVFDSIQKPDVVSWNALLLGYATNGEELLALELFSRMETSRACAADSVTYIAVLKACASLAVAGMGAQYGLEMGRKICSRTGCQMEANLQNTLIDMYSKSGSMSDARRVFDSLSKPDAVSWTVLILGYAENGEGHLALDAFDRMKRVCVPDSVTYIAVLKACGSTGALALGRTIHLRITTFTAPVVTCLVDFYAKCGSMAEAHAVFDQHPGTRDISTWNALLAGYSTCGDPVSVFKGFEAMEDERVRPDTITFLCVLLCCSHAGLVEKAREYFRAMHFHGIAPTVMHYTCLVDTLGRAKQLSEGIAVTQRMPCNADAVIWMTLLGACHKWKNVGIGSLAFQSAMDMDDTNASAIVLMAHIYGSRGMREEQVRVLESRKKLAAPKLTGQANVATPKTRRWHGLLQKNEAGLYRSTYR